MPYPAIAYNVMIASPNDVAAERAAIRQTVADWNTMHSQFRGIVLLPVGWETHASPEMGNHPQKILNKQVLKRSDLLVGVFWTRIGTPTETHASGSVEEIEEHLAANKPAMLYFSKQPVRRDSVDDEQYKKLLAFKASCMARGLLQDYEDIADFREKLLRQLQLKINDDPYFKSGLPPEDSPKGSVQLPATPTLSKDAAELLSAAAQGNGLILHVTYLSGTDVQAGGRQFIDAQDRRTIAKWEGAIKELERLGLIEDKTDKQQLYFVTNGGYRVADGLSA